jgi:hypothetical protein
MKIKLYVGEGWIPFAFEEGEPVSWSLPSAAELDVRASVARLAWVFAERVREIYPNDEVEVLPAASGAGALCQVDLGDASLEEINAALALNADELADPGFAPAEMIEGEIEGLLDGIIRERTHTWKVER